MFYPTMFNFSPFLSPFFFFSVSSPPLPPQLSLIAVLIRFTQQPLSPDHTAALAPFPSQKKNLEGFSCIRSCRSRPPPFVSQLENKVLNEPTVKLADDIIFCCWGGGVR